MMLTLPNQEIKSINPNIITIGRGNSEYKSDISFINLDKTISEIQLIIK